MNIINLCENIYDGKHKFQQRQILQSVLREYAYVRVYEKSEETLLKIRNEPKQRTEE